MPSQTRYGATIVDDASAGTIAWTSPANAGASDNARAQAAFAGVAVSHYLNAQNFGFSIPADALITGIIVTVERQASAGTVVDNAAQMLKGGAGVTPTPTPRAEAWSVGADELVRYGSDQDTWATNWTPTDINDATFGFRLRARKNDGGAGNGLIDSIAITVYYTLARTVPAVVVFRDPAPPHGAICSVYPAALRYGLQLRQMQTGSFMVSRADPSIGAIFDACSRGAPPMVTIERYDGNLPFVGFVTRATFGADDPLCAFELADHTVRLAAARTRASGRETAAAGVLLINALREIDGRGTPPLYLDYTRIPGVSPAADYEFRANAGDAFVRDLESQTGWEYYHSYDISPARVTTYAEFAQRQGYDRRDAEIYQEGRQIGKPVYTLDYRAGLAEAVAIGGTGAFGARTAVAASLSGQSAGGVTAQAFAAPAMPGLGRSLVEVTQQTSDPAVLYARAAARFTQPEYAAELMSMTILEPNTDMDALNVGDIRTVRFATAFLNQPIERLVRIVALQINPDGEHEAEAVVYTEGG